MKTVEEAQEDLRAARALHLPTLTFKTLERLGLVKDDKIPWDEPDLLFFFHVLKDAYKVQKDYMVETAERALEKLTKVTR